MRERSPSAGTRGGRASVVTRGPSTRPCATALALMLAACPREPPPPVEWLSPSAAAPRVEPRCPSCDAPAPPSRIAALAAAFGSPTTAVELVESRLRAAGASPLYGERAADPVEATLHLDVEHSATQLFSRGERALPDLLAPAAFSSSGAFDAPALRTPHVLAPLPPRFELRVDGGSSPAPRGFAALAPIEPRREIDAGLRAPTTAELWLRAFELGARGAVAVLFDDPTASKDRPAAASAMRQRAPIEAIGIPVGFLRASVARELVERTAARAMGRVTLRRSRQRRIAFVSRIGDGCGRGSPLVLLATHPFVGALDGAARPRGRIAETLIALEIARGLTAAMGADPVARAACFVVALLPEGRAAMSASSQLARQLSSSTFPRATLALVPAAASRPEPPQPRCVRGALAPCPSAFAHAGEASEPSPALWPFIARGAFGVELETAGLEGDSVGDGGAPPEKAARLARVADVATRALLTLLRSGAAAPGPLPERVAPQP